MPRARRVSNQRGPGGLRPLDPAAIGAGEPAPSRAPAFLPPYGGTEQGFPPPGGGSTRRRRRRGRGERFTPRGAIGAASSTVGWFDSPPTRCSAAGPFPPAGGRSRARLPSSVFRLRLSPMTDQYSPRNPRRRHELRAGGGAPLGGSHGATRRDPRAVGRQRRREEHAGQDPLRRVPSRLRVDRRQGRTDFAAPPRRCHGGRVGHRVPGPGIDPRPDHRAELPSDRDRHRSGQVVARDDGARRPRPWRSRRRVPSRSTTADRSRPGTVTRPAGTHARRDHRRPPRRPGGTRVHRDAHLGRQGPVGALHHPPPGRGAPDVRPRHHPPRRSQRRRIDAR